MEKTIGGNWKFNLSLREKKEALNFILELEKRIKNLERVKVKIFPAFFVLPFLAKKVKKIKIGAQDIHWETEGSFTGAIISPKELISLGIKETLIGHSETRFYFGVNEEKVRLKLKAAFSFGIFPTICVGESLKDKLKGKSKKVLEKQIEKEILPVLEELKIKEDCFEIAYEPIYAISGFAKLEKRKPLPAKIKDVETAHAQIKKIFSYYGFPKPKVLYGGSCNPKNAKKFLSSSLIDGLLVGSASWNLESFFDIIKVASKIKK